MRCFTRVGGAAVLTLLFGAAIGHPAQARECPHYGGVGVVVGFAIGCKIGTYSIADLEAHSQEFTRLAKWECTASDIDNIVAEAMVSDPDNWDNSMDLCDSVKHNKKFIDVLNRFMDSKRR